MTFEFKPAVREDVSVLIGLAGPSGSGKTKSALRLAEGIAQGKPIAFIDTEARRGLHYADAHKFIHADMRQPFRPERFVEGVRAAEDASAAVVIVDSFSHEYDGQGGIIDWADELAEGTPKPGVAHPRKQGSDPDWWKDWLVKPVTSPGNWKEPKLAHKKLVNELLQSRASLIFCMRADEKIEIVKDERGRTQVRQLGWVPICEKRFMFEMTASFTLTADNPGKPNFRLPHKLQEQHRAFFREGEFIDERAGAAIAAWARGSSPAPAKQERDQPPVSRPLEQLVAMGDKAAECSMEMLKGFWESLTAQEKHIVGGADQLKVWKRAAEAADMGSAA